ncbi:MAG: FAD-dependent oxidoreductase [bacterium]|nr:FAD-dependent oxidoreductase [bacterium]
MAPKWTASWGLKVLLVLGLLAGAGWLWQSGWLSQIDLQWVQDRQAQFEAYYQAHRAYTLTLFFLFYSFAVAVSLPGAVWLTLLSGALFGLEVGLLIASFASTLGASLAFLLSRWLLRDWVQKRFKKRLKTLNQGLQRDGLFYLATLRLVPIFPFFVINLLMGLTQIPLRTFYWVSQLSMLPGTAVYVYAGLKLGEIQSASDFTDPRLLLAFALLGAFPWFAKWGLWRFAQHRLYQPYHKPKSFDFDLLAIGAGSGGLVSAYIAQVVGAKGAIVEQAKMGGDCLNTGCVPSKSLLQTAKLLRLNRQAAALGLEPAQFKVDFGSVMASVQRRIDAVAPHDSVERYRALGVEVYAGQAKVLDPWRVEVAGQVLTSRCLVIATGAKPRVPQIKGLKSIPFRTSETLWQLKELPQRLLVLGGGPIGCELAQAFASLGSKVTQIDRGGRLLKREDPAASALIQAALSLDGVEVRLNSEVTQFELRDGQPWALGTIKQDPFEFPFDLCLIALGRVPEGGGLGLQDLGVEVDRGALRPDAYQRTRFPNILVAGDVSGGYQFTHAASHQAWYAAVNGLFAPLKKFAVDNRVMPWCTFTDPEVARVGLNEAEATDQGIAFEVSHYDLADLDRAITDHATEGFVKVLTEPGKDVILGVTIVGAHAGEWIHEWVLAMKHRLGLKKILSCIHLYPTMAEASKYAAGEWKKNHQPERVLKILRRWFTWRRG